jgi:anti-anti-sigma factor
MAPAQSWTAHISLDSRGLIGSIGRLLLYVNPKGDAMTTEQPGHLDIDERKRMTAALAERDVWIRLTGEATSDGIFYWNITLTTVEWTDRLLHLLGIARATWGGTFEDFFVRVHPDDKELVQAKIKAHFDRREPYEYELRLRHTSGDYRTFVVHGATEFSEAGAPLYMVGCLRDITERKRSETMLMEQISINQRQKDAILALSTPVIEVWEGVLTMPVLGTIDGQRAAQMTEVLLNEVTRRRCRCAIIDITGVDSVDSETADHLIKVMKAVQLLGAVGILVGIRPDVAQTIVAIGADLSRFKTLANLREALVMCMNDRLA